MSLPVATPCAAATAKMYPGPEKAKSQLGILSCPLAPLRILEVDGAPLRLKGFAARFHEDGCRGKGQKIHLLPGEHLLTAQVKLVAPKPENISMDDRLALAAGEARLYNEWVWLQTTFAFRVEAGREYKLKRDKLTLAVIDKKNKQQVGRIVLEAPAMHDAARGGRTLATLRTSSGLERIFTGQERPTLEVVNQFTKTQFIFLGWTLLGAVEVGGEGTFDLPLGDHQVIAADSPNLADNPLAESGNFESGYSYRLVVFSGS
jgi:hypothetical protein